MRHFDLRKAKQSLELRNKMTYHKFEHIVLNISGAIANGKGWRVREYHRSVTGLKGIHCRFVRTMWQIDYHAEPIQLFYHSLQSKENKISVTPNTCHSNRFHMHNPKGKKIATRGPHMYLNYATDWLLCQANSVLKSKFQIFHEFWHFGRFSAIFAIFVHFRKRYIPDYWYFTKIS